MKKFLLALLFATSAFAQDVPFTDNEILLLRAAKPLYAERVQLIHEEEDYATAQDVVDALTQKLAQANALKASWENRGKDTTIIELVIEVLEDDLAEAEEKLANPPNNSERIAELNGILLEFLDLLLEIAPEGRLRSDYVDYLT